MKKTLIFLTFLLSYSILSAQKTYQLLQKVDSFNRLNTAIISDPTNALLRTQRINTILPYNINDTILKKLSNWDTAMILEDLDFLMTIDTPILYQEQYFDKTYFLKTKIELLNKFNLEHQTLEKDYLSVLQYLKLKDSLNYDDRNLFEYIINYYKEQATKQAQEADKIAYLDKGIAAINLLFPLQDFEQLSTNNITPFRQLYHYYYHITPLLGQYPNKDRLINFYKKAIAYDYISISNDANNQYAQSEKYANLISKALDIANIFYENKDYNNAYTWVNAFFSDRQTLIDFEKITAYHIDNYTYYFYPYQIIYTYNTLQSNTDFNIILDNIIDMIKSTQTPNTTDITYFQNIFNTYEQQGNNNGKYYFTKAFFMYNTASMHFIEYRTYGKEIIALLDKAQKLGYANPEIDNILSYVYNIFENNKPMADKYEAKYNAYKDKLTQENYHANTTANNNINPNATFKLSILDLIQD